MKTEGSTPPAKAARAISLRGWLEIGARLLKRRKTDRIGLFAAGSAFFIVLSIVPALAAFVSLYGLTTDPTSLTRQINGLEGLVPAGGLEIIRDELARLTNRTDKSLSISLLTSTAFAIWSSNRGVTALFQCMNAVGNQTEDRGFLHFKAMTLLFTFSVMVFGLILLNAAVMVPLAFRFVGLADVYKLLAGVLMPLTVIISATLGISALYRWGPCCRPAGWHWINPGAIFSAIGIATVSAAFAYYLSHFGDFGATYGSLGAMIGLMIWIFLSTYVVILGAHLNVEIGAQLDNEPQTRIHT